jgi:hypothetical protein
VGSVTTADAILKLPSRFKIFSEIGTIHDAANCACAKYTVFAPFDATLRNVCCPKTRLNRLRAGSLAMRPEFELFIALIESRPFERERIRHSLQSALSLRVVTYSTTSELEHHFRDASPQVVVLSVSEVGEASTALRLLSELVPNAPVIVLAQTDDVNLAGTVMRHGAKGFIPYTMDFTIAVEALRFVLAASPGR